MFEEKHKYKIVFQEHPFLGGCEKDEEYMVVSYGQKIAFLVHNKIKFYHKTKDVMDWGNVMIIKDYGIIL
jgi:hypothetical protein